MQGTVTVYSEVAGTELRPGMTGYARIYTGKRAIGAIFAGRLVRYFRTEFWW